MSAPESFLASAGFLEILKAAGLGEVDLDAFRMLEEARQMVLDGEMEREEYDRLAKGVQLQVLHFASGANSRPPPVALAETVEKPKAPEAPPGEKPIVESFLWKQPVNANPMIPGSKTFKKRYCVLYKTCLVYYENKGDRKPKGRIDLTSDFFVQDSTAHQFGFVLSDMTTKVTLGADSEELKGYWVHMCAMVLRKIHEAEDAAANSGRATGAAAGGNGGDEAALIQKAFEARLTQYKKEKTNRRLSFLPRKQKQNQEEIERLAAEKAAQLTSKELREKELQRQKELEELQKRLDEAERERAKYKTEAEIEHERAEKESARAKEEEEKRMEAETRMAKTLEQLRAESLARELQLREEKEQTEARLMAVNNRRRQSMVPGAPEVDKAQLEAWEKERKALQAKLDALQDALNVDLGNLEWDGTLQDAEAKMKELVPKLMSDNENEAREAQATFDQWDKIIRNHAEYKAREEQKWVKWEEDNAPKNKKALEEMKKIVPFEITTGISLEFLTQQCHLSNEVAQRIMKTKILAFLYMEPDAIAKLHIADLSSRYVPQGLDIRELRAVYACLPKEFQLDADGRKKVWRETFRAKLKQMTEQEESGKLSRNDQLHPVYRPKEEKSAPALGGGGGGGGGGVGRGNPLVNAGALQAMLAARSARGPNAGPPKPKLDTTALQNALAAKLAGKGPPPAVAAVTQRSAEEAAKTQKVQEANDLLSMVKKTKASNASLADVGAPPPSAASSSSPAASTTKTTTTPASPSNADKKTSLLPPKHPSSGGPPPPMIDLGVKFNAVPENSVAPVKKVSMSGSLLAPGTAELMKKVRGSTITEDEYEGDVPMYDFEQNYAAASKRKTWVDDGIAKLAVIINDHGAFDSAEGGIKTLKYGVVYEKFGEGGDMLVGILMRGRKKGKIKYVGDMLFKGVHDDVKITLLSV